MLKTDVIFIEGYIDENRGEKGYGLRLCKEIRTQWTPQSQHFSGLNRKAGVVKRPKAVEMWLRTSATTTEKELWSPLGTPEILGSMPHSSLGSSVSRHKG
jgi:hypothetical protein